MLSALVVLGSLAVLVMLARKNLAHGVIWVIFTLPLYELGRVSLGSIPTTVVELNILLLFGWWLATTQITIRKRQITNNPQTSNSGLVHDDFGRWGLFGIWNLKFGNLRRLRADLGSWFWIVITWIAVATFSMAISPNLREAAGAWKAFFVDPILFFIVFINVINKKHIISILNALAASGTLVAVTGIIQKATGWWIENPFWAAESTRRITSVFPFPNAVGLYLAPIAIITIALAAAHLPNLKQKQITNCQLRSQSKTNELRTAEKIITKQHKKFFLFSLYSFLFALMVFGIVFARSRGALLGVSAGIAMLTIIHAGKRSWYALGIGIAFIALVASGQYTDLTNQLLNQPTSFSGGDSIQIRLEQWRETARFISDHPFLGAGMAGYQTAIVGYHTNPSVEIYNYPHNIFLNFWTEMGFAGISLFLLIIITFYRTLTIKKRDFGIENRENADHDSRCNIHDLRAATLAAMSTLLVHGLVDVPYFKNDLSVLFWILIGISIIISRNDTWLRVLSAGNTPDASRLPTNS